MGPRTLLHLTHLATPQLVPRDSSLPAAHGFFGGTLPSKWCCYSILGSCKGTQQLYTNMVVLGHTGGAILSLSATILTVRLLLGTLRLPAHHHPSQHALQLIHSLLYLQVREKQQGKDAIWAGFDWDSFLSPLDMSLDIIERQRKSTSRDLFTWVGMMHFRTGIVFIACLLGEGRLLNQLDITQ